MTLHPQDKQVLTHLQNGQSITALEALGVYGIFRLSACIYNIRQAGYEVETVRRSDARGRHYARYYLRGE